MKIENLKRLFKWFLCIWGAYLLFAFFPGQTLCGYGHDKYWETANKELNCITTGKEDSATWYEAQACAYISMQDYGIMWETLGIYTPKH